MNKNIIVSLFSILSCAVIIVMCELGTRFLFPEINFQDTQASLFGEKAFGDSIGWQPNATGISFGTRVFIDEFGFRKMSGPKNYSASWLILGDSVTFGVVVETDATFVGMLQNQFPRIKIWNTAVVGYSVDNYRDVMLHFMESDKPPRKILLLLCLNDIYGYLNLKPKPANYFYRIGYFLIRNSKLCVLLKNAFSDRSKAYFLYDYNLYSTLSNELVHALEVIYGMAEIAKTEDVDFTVVLLPYEYQLRQPDPENLLPQRLLINHFKGKDISYIDAFEYFESIDADSKQFYLYADAMHLSEFGHKTVFNMLNEHTEMLLGR